MTPRRSGAARAAARRAARRAAALALLPLVLAGCEADGRAPIMLAEYNVLVVTPESMWEAVDDVLGDSLQVRPFGQPAENPLQLTRRDPASVTRSDLQRYRMVAVVGDAETVAAVVGEAAPAAAAESPGLSGARDLWAEGQQVALVSLPAGHDEAALRALMGKLAAQLRGGLAEWTMVRAYSTGIHAGVDSLATAAGFEIDIPALYQLRQLSDSALVAASRPNDVDPLIRSVLVTWRPRDGAEMTPERALDWRDAMVPLAYEWEQTTRRDPIEVATVGGAGVEPGLQVQAFWSAVSDGQPLGGSVVLRVVDCPAQGRQYLLDGWLYAPHRGKHRYLTELSAVLDTFRCASDG